MKNIIIYLITFLFFMTINCVGKTEEPLICHLYGYIRNSSTQQGLDNLTFGLWEANNPYNLNTNRLRYFTTVMHDSLHGFFEVDSVCYGTTLEQGSDEVLVIISDTLSPGYLSAYYSLSIRDAVETVYVYIAPQD